MAAYVGSRLSGLLRDIAVSYRFGTGRELDEPDPQPVMPRLRDALDEARLDEGAELP